MTELDVKKLDMIERAARSYNTTGLPWDELSEPEQEECRNEAKRAFGRAAISAFEMQYGRYQ